ncbi:MAG: bifunctional phosphoribosylaminoimidazolecarboxamide formyltransferase/IMP cyclohydrolase [Acidobacteria bacterium]|nr:bifunctional phosphoribosylaminoimidazolecarboxamide formyltransferase/IMP cyclohydrolase [Acidobacteriota bacterium]
MTDFPFRRAVISVYDKTGVERLAHFLADRGVEIISTGGTYSTLEEAGISVRSITDLTGFPEILGGRVKTLNPSVFGGILSDRSNEKHRDEMADNDLVEIDLVVVNLYPFEETVAREGVTLREAIEQIDVGGPSMLRAAAKNHEHVLPVCDPSMYDELIRLAETGEISSEYRLEAARRVFQTTAGYDRAIAAWLGKQGTSETSERLTLDLTLQQTLRYGENPHQKAGFYSESATPPFEQLQGKELSYNNLLDLDAAWRVASSYDEPCVSIIKHTNPCGTAIAGSIADAFTRALEGDPVSAFGGILAANRQLDGETAERIGKLFLEVIVAPSFSAEALEILGKKTNLRLVVARGLGIETEVRSAAGGFLIQDRDTASAPDQWEVVTKRKPTEEEEHAMRFAWTLCAHVKSNAIVLTDEKGSVGIGAGQMSRVDAARLALEKAVSSPEGKVAASDAFFPFPDGIEVLADAGIRAIVQPGGSIRDEDVIKRADELDLAMIFTGRRHFRH